MKICLVTPSPVPFVMGGAEKLFLGMVEAINHHTAHVADLIKIPVFEQGFWGIVDGYRRFAELDLSHFDVVISTKYPAWMIRHKNHHVYLQHKLRGFYDLYRVCPQAMKTPCVLPPEHPLPDHPALDGLRSILERPAPGQADMDALFAELDTLRPLRLPEGVFSFPGPLIRAIVRFLDDVGLSPERVASYSAISSTVAGRKDYFPPDVPVRVLHHPTSLKGLGSGEPGRYLFTASRLAELKRLHLLLDAYAQVPGDTPLLIAGTGAEEFALARQAAADPRVRFLGFVPDARLAELYKGALAVPFVPYDEDYGLITLEAMHCAKPVITCADSGGVTELVRPGETGEIAAPDAASLAAPLAALTADPERARAQGLRALEAVKNLTWPHFVRDLLAQVSQPRGSHILARTRRRDDQIVVLSTFGVHPAIQGGQQRIYHIYKHLAAQAPVTLLTLGNLDCPEEVLPLGPDYVEHRVPRTKAQMREELRLKDLTGMSCGDVMAVTHWANQRYMDALAEHLAHAACVVLSHPYLAGALEGLWTGPVIYDAHNVEYDLKAPFFSHHAEVLDLVRQAEDRAMHLADLVLACSDTDRARLAELYGKDADRIAVLPNGVDMDAAQVLDDAARARLKTRLGLGDTPTALFMGSHHGPNVQAARHVLDMAARCPRWIFLMIGTVEAAFRDETIPDNVRFLDRVEPEAKTLLLNAADLGLNPMDSGSGTNMKVLDYLAHGLPVLTTPFGLRGLDIDPSTLLVYEIDSFPGVLVGFPASAGQTQKLAGEARNQVRTRYAWPVIGRQMTDLYLRSFRQEVPPANRNVRGQHTQPLDEATCGGKK